LNQEDERRRSCAGINLVQYRRATLFNDSLASNKRKARRRDARIRKQEHLRDLSDLLLLTAEQMDDSTRPTLTFWKSPIGIAVRGLSSRLPLFSSSQPCLRWRADSDFAAGGSIRA
jgi:hypothetical protein